MDESVICSDHLLAHGPQTILERTLVAEYLFILGYLVSDLFRLSPAIAKNLAEEACQYAALRLAEIETGDRFPWEIRMRISLN